MEPARSPHVQEGPSYSELPALLMSGCLVVAAPVPWGAQVTVGRTVAIASHPCCCDIPVLRTLPRAPGCHLLHDVRAPAPDGTGAWVPEADGHVHAHPRAPSPNQARPQALQTNGVPEDLPGALPTAPASPGDAPHQHLGYCGDITIAKGSSSTLLGPAQLVCLTVYNTCHIFCESDII